MQKQLLLKLTFLFLFGMSSASYSQSTPLYMGFNYTPEFAVIDTTGGIYTITDTRAYVSVLGDVSGSYGFALHPVTSEMYILYQMVFSNADERRLGILDTLTGDIDDIGEVGNLQDIAFLNSELYGYSGSYDGQRLYSVNLLDGTTTYLFNPSNDSEAGSITYNFYSGKMYFVDEDHFTELDFLTNTEAVEPAFFGFDDECNAIVMKNDSIAIVSNYEELYEFNINTLVYTYITSFGNNVHALAFGQFPLAVTIDGPSMYCSTTPSILGLTAEGLTYQWFLDGVLIAGATESTYIALVSGAYSCEVDGELSKNELLVNVIEAPVVSFTATPNPVFLGDDPTGTVNFVNATPIGDSFLWDFDNGFNSAVENPSFAFAMAGEYDVTLVVTDNVTGCVGEGTVTVLITDVEDIAINSNDFTIYPTLTQDFVTVKYSGNALNLVGSIVDLNGKVIDTKLINPNSTTRFDLSMLENGMYLIQLSNENGQNTIFKITKK